MPDIFPFWDTTTLFSPVKVHLKERKLATNSQNCQSMPKFHIFCAKQHLREKKVHHGRVGTNMNHVGEEDLLEGAGQRVDSCML